MKRLGFDKKLALLLLVIALIGVIYSFYPQVRLSEPAYICNVADLLSPSFTGCYADVNGDGNPDLQDQILIQEAASLFSWENDNLCLYDLDGDSDVDADDVGIATGEEDKCNGLPDFQDGSGLNGGVEDARFGFVDVCGDGELDASEQCDDGNTADGDGCSATCQTEGAVCSDGNIGVGEVCDCGNDGICSSGELNGETCVSQGFDGGFLGCSPECDSFDTGVCSSAVCGNGIIEGTEECDSHGFNQPPCSPLLGDMSCQSCEGSTCTFTTFTRAPLQPPALPPTYVHQSRGSERISFLTNTANDGAGISSYKIYFREGTSLQEVDWILLGTTTPGSAIPGNPIPHTFNLNYLTSPQIQYLLKKVGSDDLIDVRVMAVFNDGEMQYYLADGDFIARKFYLAFTTLSFVGASQTTATLDYVVQNPEPIDYASVTKARVYDSSLLPTAQQFGLLLTPLGTFDLVGGQITITDLSAGTNYNLVVAPLDDGGAPIEGVAEPIIFMTADSASCGNGDIIDAGEECDGTNLNERSCISLGYDGGSLSCNLCSYNFACSYDQTICLNFDFDDDGDVELDDRNFILSNIGICDVAVDQTCAEYDLNGNGGVDTQDSGLFSAYISSYGAGVATECPYGQLSCNDCNSPSDGSGTCLLGQPNPNGCGDGNMGNTPGDAEDIAEECDYGDILNGDGCSATCQIEIPPTSSCGNNLKETGETCDGTDLNSQSCSLLGYTSGDLSCLETCLGFDVSLCVSVCENGLCETGENAINCNPVCGNNIVETGETCDDNNLVSGDGCNSACQTETSPPPPNPGGGGPSGGGPSAPSYWVQTFDAVPTEFAAEGYTKQLQARNRLKVVVGNVNHYVGVRSLGTGSAEIEVSSTPQIVTLLVGQQKKFEVTGDGFYDIFVTLKAIANNKAEITVQAIHDEVPVATQPTETGEQETPEETTNVSGNEQEPLGEKRSSSTAIVITIIIIMLIAGAIGYFIIIKRRNILKKYNIKS